MYRVLPSDLPACHGKWILVYGKRILESHLIEWQVESIMTVTPCKYVHVVPEQTG